MTRTALAAALVALAACSRERPPSPDAGVPAAPSSSSSPATTLLSDHDAELLVKNTCSSCHAREMLAQQRLTPAQWSRTVTKMVDWGALLEPRDVGPLTTWLASTYAVDAGAWEPTVVPPEAAAAAIAPLPDGPFGGGDPERGRAGYVERCSGCHGPEAKGHIGVNLRDRPFLYRAPDFAATIREGRGKMLPIRMTDAEIADVLAYLRTLPSASR